MNRITFFTTLLLFAFAHGSLLANPNFEITIGTRHAQMRYAPEVFAVKPGSRVSLILDNTDEMIHNLVLAKADSEKINQLAESALKLGEKGMEMGFIPRDPSIIAGIGLVQPGEQKSVKFTAPLLKGDYPFVCTFPGHSLSMRGVMKVMDDPGALTQSKIESADRGTTPKNGVLLVGSEARVIRVHISGVDSGRSIAVGLPDGFNYLFDAEKLMVRTGWTGPFLNVARDRRSRGGGPCSILGKQFKVGSSEFPLRIGNPDKVPSVRFCGYSRLGNPKFMYEVDGSKVTQTVTGSPDRRGLTYGFEVTKAHGDVYFKLNPDGLRVSTTAGDWKRGRGLIRIPADEADEFFISVEQI